MPREGVTIYDILLSCPSDVSNLKDIVKECIDDFNRMYGNINNIKLDLKHWSTDAYPQSGGSAQKLLNSQFIHDCDACIALLGTRFGSPTDRYDSGTEEEIEDMISSDKQVFMYFIEKQVDPSSIDFKQYSKVRDFKDKYISDSKGIYWTIKDDYEFKKQLTNHLSLHFLNLITKPNSNLFTKNLPELEISIDKSGDKRFQDLSSFKLISSIEEDIKKKIDLINDLPLPCIEIKSVEESNTYNKSSENVNSLLNNLDFNKFSKLIDIEYKEVELNDSDIQTIVKYCNKNNIILKDDFWNLGNLKKVLNSPISLPIYSSSSQLKGSEEEKNEYKLIKELIYKVYKYNEYTEYFSTIGSYSYFSLYLKNTGTTFDEDIDVTIIVPKQHLLKNNEIPIPGITCINDINESNLVHSIFCASPNANIERYGYYPIQKLNDFYIPQLYNKSASEVYEDEKKEYIDDINRIFCYKYYYEEDKDIVKFNIDYLKQNKSMYFPSILLFKNKIECIEYEITSKHYPTVIKGKCSIKDNN